jgi:hypothetical protein
MARRRQGWDVLWPGGGRDGLCDGQEEAGTGCVMARRRQEGVV